MTQLNNTGLRQSAQRLAPLSEQSRETSSGRKALDESRKDAVEQLKKVHYFHKQAHWLQEY